MKGTHRIILQSKKIKYDFEVRRNITIIRGDSGSGKTTLIEMIDNYNNYGKDSGVALQCDKECVVLAGRNWEKQLSHITDSIVFVDEGNSFIKKKEFASAIKNTDNYYVLVTREKLSTLPYSVYEIYGIKNSGKYANVKQVYNEMYYLYNSLETQYVEKPTLVITEDANAGFEFFNCAGKMLDFKCLSANGKSNIISTIYERENEKVLIIVDGAAFGPEMDAVEKCISNYENYSLYTPESFEWLILHSGIFQDFDFQKEIKEILETPTEFIESRQYFSWEQYFTDLLTSMTKDLKEYAYSKKGNLKEWYKQSNNINKVIRSIEKVDFNTMVSRIP